MSAPQTINEYLAAFNEALEVGLRSRRRIFWEVTEHLRQAAQEQMRSGANAREAERRAIASFGAPEDVAARFETGAIGRLDRRLALSIRWLYGLATKRLANVVFAVTALGLFLAAAVAAVAASFGRDAFGAASGFLVMGPGVATAFAWLSRKREFRESPLSAVPPVFLLAYPAVISCVVLLARPTDHINWDIFVAGMLTYLVLSVIQGVIEAGIERAARRCSGTTGAARRLDWRQERPWRAAVADVAPLTFALLALIVAYPGPAPGDLRAALAGLLAVLGALAVAVVRLDHGRREKDGYRTYYDRLTPGS